MSRRFILGVRRQAGRGRSWPDRPAAVGDDGRGNSAGGVFGKDHRHAGDGSAAGRAHGEMQHRERAVITSCRARTHGVGSVRSSEAETGNVRSIDQCQCPCGATSGSTWHPHALLRLATGCVMRNPVHPFLLSAAGSHRQCHVQPHLLPWRMLCAISQQRNKDFGDSVTFIYAY